MTAPVTGIFIRVNGRLGLLLAKIRRKKTALIKTTINKANIMRMITVYTQKILDQIQYI